MKKRSLQMLAAGSLLAASVGHALAVNVGGLEIPLGAAFTAGQIYSGIPTTVGGQLSGYGKIDSFNSEAIGDLCGVSCELTYVFDGYTVSSFVGTTANFTGGTMRVYLGTGADKDFSTQDAGSSVADDVAEASNGTLWLTLKGRAIDADGNTFRSTGTNGGTPSFTGNGEGLFDVDMTGGGVANAFFNSNTVPATFGGGAADFYVGASFNGVAAPYPNTLRGSLDLTTAAVPEPQTYALMLSALGIIGYVVNRRRRT